MFVAKKEAVVDQSAPRSDSGRRERPAQCSNCGRTGHKKANCWQLVGFPDWWEERSPNRGAGGNIGSSRDVRMLGGSSASDRNKKTSARAHATTSNSSAFPEFTNEQWRALSQMLSEKAHISSDKNFRKNIHGDLILDT